MIIEMNGHLERDIEMIETLYGESKPEYAQSVRRRYEEYRQLMDERNAPYKALNMAWSSLVSNIQREWQKAFYVLCRPILGWLIAV